MHLMKIPFQLTFWTRATGLRVPPAERVAGQFLFGSVTLLIWPRLSPPLRRREGVACCVGRPASHTHREREQIGQLAAPACHIGLPHRTPLTPPPTRLRDPRWKTNSVNQIAAERAAGTPMSRLHVSGAGRGCGEGVVDEGVRWCVRIAPPPHRPVCSSHSPLLPAGLLASVFPVCVRPPLLRSECGSILFFSVFLYCSSLLLLLLTHP